jgi:hypothetical protein
MGESVNEKLDIFSKKCDFLEKMLLQEKQLIEAEKFDALEVLLSRKDNYIKFLMGLINEIKITVASTPDEDEVRTLIIFKANHFQMLVDQNRDTLAEKYEILASQIQSMQKTKKVISAYKTY